MSNEQKTAAEILASVRSEAAPCGWGPVTRNGCSIEFARICGERIYGEVMLADGMYGFLWETDTGEEVEKCSSLVPLPAPPERDAEPERVRESTLLAFEIHASGDIRKMARECIASRRREAEQDMLIGLQRDEIGRLRAENKTLAESVCDLTTERLDVERKCETLQSVAARDLDMLRERAAEIERLRCKIADDRDDLMSAELRKKEAQAEIDRLTAENLRLRDMRDDCLIGADTHRKEIDRLRGVLHAEITKTERLTRELAESNRIIDLQAKQISHQAKQCEELERERDEARERLNETIVEGNKLTRELVAAEHFNRRFRDLFNGGPGETWAKCCRDYDASIGQPEQPEAPAPATRLVPWTADTRPRGPMAIRPMGQSAAEFSPGWDRCGESSDNSRIGWNELVDGYEWSRDGEAWLPCGTEVPA